MPSRKAGRDSCLHAGEAGGDAPFGTGDAAETGVEIAEIIAAADNIFILTRSAIRKDKAKHKVRGTGTLQDKDILSSNILPSIVMDTTNHVNGKDVIFVKDGSRKGSDPRGGGTSTGRMIHAGR
ncbi:MAG: hypothetical protein ABS95_01585 [Verrucomicrobia bacterium SCN 57-15]|nr:MAG: hypothetical protein ABS95_01585 [Verrucomicrobia bacterium SCN 57-15]